MRLAFKAAFLSLIVFFVSGFARAAQSEIEKWEKFDFARNLITPAQIQNLSTDDLKLLRGIVFGRRGRIFRDEEIQQYLYSRDWYKPADAFRNSMLTDTERKNLDRIREAEAMRHEKIEPGDMRFWQTRLFTPDKLGKHTLAELRILRAEIEAIHGKRFDDEPGLQTYFEERYWYKPAAKYHPSELSEIERGNIAVIASVEKRQRNVKLQPGDMIAFQNRLLTEDMLAGLGLYELRILRNEVYALRGRQFRTPWIAEYFYNQPWYNPLPDFREPRLTDIETKNIATIVKVENQIHERLSNESISPALLDGLFLEDATKLRNEIYARRGRVFQNRWLQKYFESFQWYKANPAFSEKLLTDIERKNIATIREYEKTAESSLRQVEG
ncbi:MAG TPA: YARHG domain-containing protein [Blastocatellia bacterium]